VTTKCKINRSKLSQKLREPGGLGVWNRKVKSRGNQRVHGH
jgi:hypothetical protein